MSFDPLFPLGNNLSLYTKICDNCKDRKRGKNKIMICSKKNCFFRNFSTAYHTKLKKYFLLNKYGDIMFPVGKKYKFKKMKGGLLLQTNIITGENVTYCQASDS